MRKLNILIILILLLSLFPMHVNAQEVSAPESRWNVRVYSDVNGNFMPDEGEEVSGVTVKWGYVNGTTCSSVDDSDEFNGTGEIKSPTFIASGLSCHFFLLGNGNLSPSNYSAKRTSGDGQGLVPDVWMKIQCKTCKVYTPSMRSWSGQ